MMCFAWVGRFNSCIRPSASITMLLVGRPIASGRGAPPALLFVMVGVEAQTPIILRFSMGDGGRDGVAENERLPSF